MKLSGSSKGSATKDKVQALEHDIQSCLKIAEFVLHEKSIDDFLNLVLEECISRLDADRGSIFLLDKNENILKGFATTGVDKSINLQIPASQGIVGETVSSGKILNIKNAYSDSRFFKEIDTLTGYETKSILCSPIATHLAHKSAHKQKSINILGAIELLNPKNKLCFDTMDEASLSHILSFASLRLNEYTNIEHLLKSKKKLEQEVAHVRGFFDDETSLSRIVGSSVSVENLKQIIWSAAPFDSPILIQGESGTGKELVAHCIHALSSRKNGPFIALNCAAIPESLMEAELFGIESGVATGVSKRIGKIESAHGGTLFLDEIGEMSAPTQAKLLRAVQEKEIVRVGGKSPINVDVRFVSATHRNLKDMISQHTFREDLYYRLHVVQINVPCLRERKSDIAALAISFLETLNQKYNNCVNKSFSPEVLVKLTQNQWPGNVRQLQNEVERLFVISGTNSPAIELSHLSLQEDFNAEENNSDFLNHANLKTLEVSIGTPPDSCESEIRGLALHINILNKSLPEVQLIAEKLLIAESLKKNKGNKSRVAEELGISREGLRKMMARWGESHDRVA